MPGESGLAGKGVGSGQVFSNLLAPTKQQRIDFISVELKLGLTWARISNAAYLAGDRTQASETMDRARGAYNRALKVFNDSHEIGTWRRHSLRGKLEKLAQSLRQRQAGYGERLEQSCGRQLS